MWAGRSISIVIRKALIRFVAFLLIPCLLADYTSAAWLGVHKTIDPQAFPRLVCFQEQALAQRPLERPMPTRNFAEELSAYDALAHKPTATSKETKPIATPMPPAGIGATDADSEKASALLEKIRSEAYPMGAVPDSRIGLRDAIRDAVLGRMERPESFLVKQQYDMCDALARKMAVLMAEEEWSDSLAQPLADIIQSDIAAFQEAPLSLSPEQIRFALPRTNPSALRAYLGSSDVPSNLRRTVVIGALPARDLSTEVQRRVQNYHAVMALRTEIPDSIRPMMASQCLAATDAVAQARRLQRTRQLILQLPGLPVEDRRRVALHLMRLLTPDASPNRQQRIYKHVMALTASEEYKQQVLKLAGIDLAQLERLRSSNSDGVDKMDDTAESGSVTAPPKRGGPPPFYLNRESVIAAFEARHQEGLECTIRALNQPKQEGGNVTLLYASFEFGVPLDGMIQDYAASLPAAQRRSVKAYPERTYPRLRFPNPKSVLDEIRRRSEAGWPSYRRFLYRSKADGGDYGLLEASMHYGIPLPTVHDYNTESELALGSAGLASAPAAINGTEGELMPLEWSANSAPERVIVGARVFPIESSRGTGIIHAIANSQVVVRFKSGEQVHYPLHLPSPLRVFIPGQWVPWQWIEKFSPNQIRERTRLLGDDDRTGEIISCDLARRTAVIHWFESDLHESANVILSLDNAVPYYVFAPGRWVSWAEAIESYPDLIQVDARIRTPPVQDGQLLSIDQKAKVLVLRILTAENRNYEDKLFRVPLDREGIELFVPVALRPVPTTLEADSVSSRNNTPSAAFSRLLTIAEEADRNIIALAQDHREEHQRHVDASRQFIVAGTVGLRGAALLLGVGPANDYTVAGLEALAVQFDHVLVVDLILPIVEDVLARIDPALRPKFHVEQNDLSHSLLDLATRGEELMSTTSSATQAMEDWIAILRKLAEEVVSRPMIPYQASYVVSSLLASQLTAVVDVYIAARMQERFGQISATRDYFVALTDLVRALQTRHIQDLHAWVAADGKVYFSDTVTETDTQRARDGRIIAAGLPIPTVVPELMGEIERLFTTIETREWDWNRQPPTIETGSRGFGNHVHAALLAPKRTNPAINASA